MNQLGVSTSAGSSKCLVDNGKSQSKMDDLGVPHFRKPLSSKERSMNCPHHTKGQAA